VTFTGQHLLPTTNRIHFKPSEALSSLELDDNQQLVKPEPTEPSRPEPVVLRMLLGAHLRRLREAADITRERAGYEIRASQSKISRMETGRIRFSSATSGTCSPCTA